MDLEATILAAVVTLAVLAVVTVVMVWRYNRSHHEEIRQNLLKQANKYKIASAEELTNRELTLKIREAKHERKQQKMKTA